MISKIVLIAIFASIAIALAVTPSASSWGVLVSQEVKAQTVSSLSGSGTGGSYTCPNGVKKTGLSISFGATGQSGTWGISGKSGKINFVQINNGLTYIARGSEMVNALCFGAPISQSIEISGNCGLAKPINYKENSNLKSTFTGNVNCNGGGGSTCTSTSGTSTSTSTGGSAACATSNQPVSCQTSGTGVAIATSGSTSTTCPK